MIAFTNDDHNDDDDVFDTLKIIIELGDGLSIYAHLFPNGTVRFGLSDTSSFLGYDYKYYSQVFKRGSKKLKALKAIGFTGLQLKARVRRLTGGATLSNTISFDDFCLLIEFEAVEVKNTRAIGLLTASFREVLRGRTQVTLGQSEDDLETKEADFVASFYEREAIRTENREDVEGLALAGDEDRNIAEYDPAFARFENDTLYAKYSSYYPEYFDEAA